MMNHTERTITKISIANIIHDLCNQIPQSTIPNIWEIVAHFTPSMDELMQLSVSLQHNHNSFSNVILEMFIRIMNTNTEIVKTVFRVAAAPNAVFLGGAAPPQPPVLGRPQTPLANGMSNVVHNGTANVVHNGANNGVQNGTTNGVHNVTAIPHITQLSANDGLRIVSILRETLISKFQLWNTTAESHHTRDDYTQLYRDIASHLFGGNQKSFPKIATRIIDVRNFQHVICTEMG
jgi:hypothetical protein